MAKSKAPVVLFLGAGASAPIGFPTTKQIMNNIGLEPRDPDKLNRLGRQGQLGDLLHEIYTQLPENARDIEGILDFLRICNFKSDIGNFPPFKIGIDIIKDKIGTIEGVDQSIIDRINEIYDNTLEGFSSLNRRIENLLTRYYEFKTEHREKIVENYKPIIDILLHDQNYGEIDELPVFTTNYDLVFENLAQRSFMTNYEFINGFEEEKVTGQLIFNDKLYEKEITKQTIKLFKLHGSLSWFTRLEDNAIVDYPTLPGIVTGDSFRGPLIIPPAGFDKYPRDEFHILHKYFEKYLSDAETCFVIGYSFRDIGRVGHIFLDVMKDINKDLHVIISGKRKDIKELNETWNIFKDFEGRYTYYSDGIENLPSKLKNDKKKRPKKINDTPKTPT